jgi:hypothetical protein
LSRADELVFSLSVQVVEIVVDTDLLFATGFVVDLFLDAERRVGLGHILVVGAGSHFCSFFTALK